MRLEVAVGIERDWLLKGPAGEGAGALFDVLLGVVADAHREQLEQLAAVVLVDRTGVVLAVVQPVDHGRVARETEQQCAQIAQAVAAEQLDVADHGRRVLALGPAGREDVVPEERHLLFERPLRVDHAVEPATVPGALVVHAGQVG